LLHVYVKNLNSAYGGAKAGYTRLYYIACSGDTNNNSTVIESYKQNITTFTAATSGQGCAITTDSDCCIAYCY
jgi:hypothetical protein